MVKNCSRLIQRNGLDKRNQGNLFQYQNSMSPQMHKYSYNVVEVGREDLPEPWRLADGSTARLAGDSSPYLWVCLLRLLSVALVSPRRVSSAVLKMGIFHTHFAP